MTSRTLAEAIAATECDPTCATFTWAQSTTEGERIGYACSCTRDARIARGAEAALVAYAGATVSDAVAAGYTEHYGPLTPDKFPLVAAVAAYERASKP